MIKQFSKILATFIFLGLSGCTTVTPIVGPDGTTNQLISCPSIENCYAEATATCNGPYKIINTNSETSGANGSTGTVVKLLVKCN